MLFFFFFYMFLWLVCAGASWILHMGWSVYLMWPGLVVCLGIIASALGSPVLKVLIPSADPEDLLCFKLSGGLYCGSLTQSSMCYSSRVVMSCQKQPWQMQLFSLWNGRVGVTLPTAITIPFSLRLQNLFCGQNSKAGCLICQNWCNIKLQTVCHMRQGWENKRES